jgi:DNA-binding response OmpR family regulator
MTAGGAKGISRRSTSIEKHEAALEAGCDDYLTKPLDVGEFDRVLGRLLPGWRGGG